MILKVTYTGNCPAIIIPKDVAKQLDIKPGDFISVEFKKKITE